MGKGSCVLLPKVKGNGKPSKLYKGLNDNPNLKNDRLTVNYIYASYLQSGVADAMDAAGYKRDSNGEHYADDVYDYFNITQLRRERADINTQKQEAGVTYSSGNVIEYTSSLEALQKVNDYNNTAKGYVASVHKQKDHFIIMLQEKNALTQHIQGDMNLMQENYSIAKNHIDSKTHDGFFDKLLEKFPNAISLLSLKSNLTWINSVTGVRNNALMQSDIHFLMQFADTAQISRLITKYGNLENASKVLYDHYKGTTVSSSELALLEGSLNSSRAAINRLGIEQLKGQLKQSIEYNDISYSIKETLDELNQKYKLNSSNVKVVSDSIKTLSDAAAKAAILLNRRLKNLERQQEGGNEIEKQAIKSTIQKLLSDIESNREYSSILDFLEEVSLQFENIPQLIQSINQIGEDQFDTLKKSSSTIIEIENIINTYEQLLQELSTSPKLLVDFDILDVSQKNEVISKSKMLLDKIIEYKTDLVTIKKSIFSEILKTYFGETLPDGRDVYTLAEMAQADSTIMDHLYSWSRVSNPVVALMGKITRDAQQKRTKIMFEYQKRVQVCEEKLKKAGVRDTKWMYTEDGYIVSPYDWKTYHDKRNKEWGRLKKLKLSTFEIEEQMAIWEETHTQEIIVDEISGRTERVPIYLLQQVPPFILQYDDTDLVDDKTKAKSDYYKEMMQIKGELGTLLPSYAQHHFLPPQVRREFTDTEFKHWLKIAWNGITNIFHRENDEEFLANNALYHNDEMKYINAEASYDGTIKRSIPIFYVKKLKNQEELLKNFSGAMSFLTKTAVNYYCLNEVLDMVTLMGNYAKGLNVQDTSNGYIAAESVENDHLTLINKLKKAVTSRTAGIVDGFIDKEFFNVRLVNQGTWSKIMKALLQYASIKGLSTNVLGAGSNLIAGEYQLLVEAIGSQHLTLADWAGAQAILFGDKVLKSPGHLMDFFTNNTNVYNTLIGNLFDPQNDVYEEIGSQRYKKGVLRHILGNINTHALYAIGENILHYTLMYGMLLHEKVLLDGKKISLYNAFEKVDIEGSSVKTLKFKDGVTTLDGRPLTDIHDEFVDQVRGKIRTKAQECNGAMSEEDKGLISRQLWGRCLMQMRQWMVEHLSRRYRGLHYDGSTESWTEGYWVTAWKWVAGDMDNSLTKKSKRGYFRIRQANKIIQDYTTELEKRRDGVSTMSETAFKSLQHKAKLAENRKANLIKFFADVSMTIMLLVLSRIILPPPEETEGESWAFRVFTYWTNRLATEQFQSTPIGAVLEAKSLYKNPAYVASTINGLTYPIYGLLLGDHEEYYKSGIHRGESKYLTRLLKYTVPFYKDYEKLIHLQDNSDIFMPFDPTYQLTR